MEQLPTGIVTFLFTDIEGSTKIAQAYPDQWETLRGRHHEILRHAIQSHNGFVFQIVGDEFCAVFYTPIEATRAAYAAQQALQSEPWDPATIKVRMGINTGAAQVGNVNDPSGGYTGYAALARVNRVMSAGHGGQILLSDSSAELARPEMPENATLLDMGEHRMKGLLSPEHLWQVEAPGLACDFPPLKTLTSIPNSQVEQLASFVEREKGVATGLEVLAAELPLRAPVLMDKFNELASRLRPSTVERTYQERFEALREINDLCLEALDTSFITLCTGEAPPGYDARCPFRGLESFHPEDCEFFFGREALTHKLVDKINAHPFLAVLGASGSGKSSLVMAGLIPALGLDYVIFRPGTNPLIELNFALSSARENTLIVVDQFEETFTLTTNEVTRTEFIAKLLAASQRYKVIITLRSDFLGEVAPYRELNEEIQNHLENVPPMNMDELYQSMAGQAGKTGLRFEADLGQQILDDVAGEPGAMPLLQHALWMLWQRRHGLWLKIEEYKNFGGVRQAIASTAENVYNSRSAFEQEYIRDVFLRLTRLDESAERRDTRRRVPLDDLLQVGRDPASCALLLDVLANARLIVKTVKDDQTEIEVAHEALIRHWERLRGWLDEDRDKLRLRESVGESAREWMKSRKDEALLNHRGGRLDDALALGSDVRYGLTSLERDYLNTCLALRTREQHERERRLRWTMIASLVAAVIFLTLGIYASLQRDKAEEQAVIAQAGEYSALASAKLQTQPVQAMLMSVEAFHKLENYQTRSMLFATASSAANIRQTMFYKYSGIYGLAFSPDGRLIVTGGMDGSVAFWDASSYQMLGQPRLNHTAWVDELVFTPDGKTLATIADDGLLLFWDVDTQNIKGKPLDAGYGPAFSAAFSPDGQTIAVGYQNGAIVLWDPNTFERIDLTPSSPTGFVNDLMFLSDGNTLASGNYDGTLVFWDVESLQQIGEPLTGHTKEIWGLALSPDGKMLASGGADGTVILWDVSARKAIQTITGNVGPIRTIAFSPDGEKLAAGSENGLIMVWNMDQNQMIGKPLAGHGGIVSGLAFSPDGKVLASTGNTDQTIILWDAAVNVQLASTVKKHDRGQTRVTFNHDGTVAASAGEDGYIYLWEVGHEPVAVTAELVPDADSVTSVRFSPDGQTLASGGNDGKITLWDTTSSKRIGDTLAGTNGAPYDLLFTDHKTLWAANKDGTISVWDLLTRQLIGGPLPAHESSVRSLSLSPDGKTLASAGDDGRIRFWTVATQRPAGDPISGHKGPIYGIKFGPDGKIIASAGFDGSVILWDATTHAMIGKPLTSSGQSAYALDFSPDSSMLASGWGSGTVILWDTSTRQTLGQPMFGFGNLVTGVAFSSKDNLLAFSDSNGAVHFLKVDPHTWEQDVCRKAGRNFTLAEWTYFFHDIPYHVTCPQWSAGE